MLPMILGAINIPIMIQDAPVAGAPLSVRDAGAGWRESSSTSAICGDRETAGAASKLRSLIEAAGGEDIEGPWDGEEADHAARRSRCRARPARPPAARSPTAFARIVELDFAGNWDKKTLAAAEIRYENRQCGLIACKSRWIAGRRCKNKSDAVRHPLQPLHPADPGGIAGIGQGAQRSGAAARDGAP